MIKLNEYYFEDIDEEKEIKTKMINLKEMWNYVKAEPYNMAIEEMLLNIEHQL